MKNIYKIDYDIYITSDEEINKNTETCWCIDTSNNELVLHQGVLPDYHYKNYKKIIMTTDTSINVLCGCGKDCGAKESGVQAIDDEFLEWFVKNPSCEKVEVGYGWIRLAETDNEGYWVSIPDKQFEMQQEEPKQDTLEEAANNWIKSTSEFLSVKNGFKAGAKWQAEQDKNKYSEEEVCEFVEWLNLHYRSLEHTISFKDARGTKELLQQFKKQHNEQ
jgi:hypothetical protein